RSLYTRPSATPIGGGPGGDRRCSHAQSRSAYRPYATNICNKLALDFMGTHCGHVTYPLRDSAGDGPYCLRGEGQGAASLPCAVPRPDTWGTATTTCRVPMVALLWPPARVLRDSLWTRAGMGGRIASRPPLCYPCHSPGPAALHTIRAPAGGRGAHCPSASTPACTWGTARAVPSG